jgi:uncharacterized protein YbbK (DUF523 family)
VGFTPASYRIDPGESRASIGPVKIRLGVSLCLLGELVRHDGGHKRDRYVTDVLARTFELVPVCPEVEIGLGVPRESIDIFRVQDEERLRGTGSGLDHTDAMGTFARRMVEELRAKGISGYVTKARSPSCALSDARVLGASGATEARAPGMFARVLREAFPDMPMVDEKGLLDEKTRSAFLDAVAAYQARNNREVPFNLPAPPGS